MDEATTRDRILETAAALFGERDFAGVRLAWSRDFGGLPVDPAVVVSTGFDERLMSSFRENGYTREEVERSFQQGSRAFSLFETDAAAPAGAAVPVSTCFIFKNYENIWEIGGLRTLPEFRRRGLGKKVVAAAVNDLLARGLIPRYQVVETNRPSINLAISLGMEPFVTTEHFLL